jgi:hypothetical protein
VLAHRLFLLHVRLTLLDRPLLILLILPTLVFIRLLRRLPRLDRPLLILLDHCVLLAITLLLRRSCPLPVARDPVRMVTRYPTWILVVPPFPIMPLVLVVIRTVLVEPP